MSTTKATIAVLSLLIVGTLGYASQQAQGGFDYQGLNNQVQNHEQRIGNLEKRVDQTQTQVNQNIEDLKVLQSNTKTDSAPPVQPVVTPVETVPPPVDSQPASSPPSSQPTDPPHNTATVGCQDGPHGTVCP